MIVASVNEDIDALIKREEAALLPVCTKMATLKARFIKETIAFSLEWYRKTIQQYVAKYPEVTLGMKAETIIQMKAKVMQLIKNAEKIVNSELNNPALWWHEDPHLNDPVDKYEQVDERYSEVLDHAIRRILGHIGLILEDFNYNVIARGSRGTYKEFWFEYKPDGKETVPYYPHILKWTIEMQDIIRHYDGQYLEALALFKKINLLKEEKKRQEALSLWDSIES